MRAVWYLDDENVKHVTVVRDPAELIFLKERFDFVGTLEDFMVKA
jgi:hypothetical protein